MRRPCIAVLALVGGGAKALEGPDEFSNHMRALMALPKLVYPRNGSMPTFISNETSPANLFRASGTVRGTGTASPTPTATAITDTTCGEDATPFTVSVTSTPGGLFDGWFLKVSGNGLLFTREASRASRLSVEPSGHLCAVEKGYAEEEGGPAIAVVETREGLVGSPLWFMRVKVLENVNKSFAPAQCATGSGALACVEGTYARWLGCGMQLGLGQEGEGTTTVNGDECPGVNLQIV